MARLTLARKIAAITLIVWKKGLTAGSTPGLFRVSAAGGTPEVLAMLHKVCWPQPQPASMSVKVATSARSTRVPSNLDSSETRRAETHAGHE